MFSTLSTHFPAQTPQFALPLALVLLTGLVSTEEVRAGFLWALSLAIPFLLLRRITARDKRQEEIKAAEKKEKEALLARIEKLEADKTEQGHDLSNVLDIVEEVVETNKLMAGIVAASSMHEKRLDNHENQFREHRQLIESIQQRIHDLALRGKWNNA